MIHSNSQELLLMIIGVSLMLAFYSLHFKPHLSTINLMSKKKENVIPE